MYGRSRLLTVETTGDHCFSFFFEIHFSRTGIWRRLFFNSSRFLVLFFVQKKPQNLCSVNLLSIRNTLYTLWPTIRVSINKPTIFKENHKIKGKTCNFGIYLLVYHKPFVIFSLIALGMFCYNKQNRTEVYWFRRLASHHINTNI